MNALRCGGMRRGLMGWLAAVGISTVPAAIAAQQPRCSTAGVATCSIVDSPTFAITLTITRAVRVGLSTAGVALDAPGSDDFDAGFGQTTGPTVTVRTNTPWTLTMRATQATWTASALPARANKPVTDLQWSTTTVGPFADYSTTAVTLGSGVATTGVVIPLYLRVKYSWLLDTPGQYTIPLQLTITAP